MNSMQIDPPDPPPAYEGDCPYCQASDEEIEFFDVEYDGDAGVLSMDIIYKCSNCGETFS